MNQSLKKVSEEKEILVKVLEENKSRIRVAKKLLKKTQNELSNVSTTAASLNLRAQLAAIVDEVNLSFKEIEWTLKTAGERISEIKAGELSDDEVTDLVNFIDNDVARQNAALEAERSGHFYEKI
jgi:predicted site-specific integrase-resolvase